MNERISIQTLSKHGIKKNKIADQIGCHRNTVRNIEKEDSVKEKVNRDKCKHPLDQFKDFIQDKLDKNLLMTRIIEDLITEKGYITGYDSLRKYVKTRKLKGNNKACIVLNTGPGQESQVDFGYAGLTPDNTGKLRKSWVFVMTLSFSRKAFQITVYDQKTETFIWCHIKAFEYFLGVPAVVKIDNLKAAIITASKFEPEYNKEYLAFSKYYGFDIYPCKVRAPQEKGKVESGVKYVKNSFFKGRTGKNNNDKGEFKNKDDLDYRLFQWQEKICNKRKHGTTKQVPDAVFESQEKSKLKQLPKKAWGVCIYIRRKVSTTCHVTVESNYYSVPYKQIGNNVDVKIGENIVNIHDIKTDEIIAVHNRIKDTQGQYCTNNSHYPDYKRIDLQTEYQFTQGSKMKDIGDDAYKYFLRLVKDSPRTWSSVIKGILYLKKTYKNDVINLACKRASVFEVFGYKVIENICREGLYKEELQIYANTEDIKNTKNNSNKDNNIINRSYNDLVRPLSYYNTQILFSNFGIFLIQCGMLFF